jgi:maltose alpha-D-glucosyltransferase/alpha-amylase
MVFPGVQKETWTRDPVARAWYHHRFYDFQPDLNMDNPDVRAEIRRIMGYWLELGVDGFRVDAVPFVIESSTRAGPGSLRFEYLAEMREFLQWRAGSAVLLGEANVLPEDTLRYFSDGRDALHMMFNFYANQHLFYALACADARPLAHALRKTRKIPGIAQWATFLRNHDELDLGRLTPEQQQVVFERFGPEPQMQLYDRGIRRRLASMLGDRAHIELAYSVLFSLPGTPVLRYGDEIGMGEDLSLSERTAVRTPMQWTDERNAGFSTAKRTLEPVISKGAFAYSRVNVEAQRHDPNSLLNWTARMIRTRKECPEIGWGEWTLLKGTPKCVMALCYSMRGNRVVTLHNFSHQPQEVRLRLDGSDADRLANLLGHEPSRSAADGAHHITLESHGYRWYRVGTPNYALDRSRRGRGAYRN